MRTGNKQILQRVQLMNALTSGDGAAAGEQAAHLNKETTDARDGWGAVTGTRKVQPAAF
jgi:hypothetical protein